MSIWTLSFRAEGPGPPVEIRVRRLLKAALRRYGLRCVDMNMAGDARQTNGERRKTPGPQQRT
jgi:hypothetical protein